MKVQQLQVALFHHKAGLEINTRPTIPRLDTINLRHKLIQEEFDELMEALYRGSTVDTADALADLLYVVLGTAVSCGIEMEPIFDEVQRSNMTKFIDGYRRDDGKWIKGPSYTPANIAKLIDEQNNIPTP